MSKWENKQKPVVVLGGGGAGATTARALSQTLDKSKYSLTLINPLPYRVVLPATVRMTVTATDKLDETALIPYDKLFLNGNGTFKQGKVESISLEGYEKDEGGVLLLEGGEKVEFHILVLATGSTWPGPTTFPETQEGVKEHINARREDVKNAKNIVLIGGGAVGVETAGELKTEFPDKKVTIVHGGSQLVNDTYSVKYRKTLEKRCTKIGIELVLGETVEDIPASNGPEVKTKSGKTIPADLVLVTTGPRPNTALIASSLGASTLAANNCVKVKPTLQLAEHANIFAVGDIIDWKEQKQVMKAVNHAALVAVNIPKYLAAGGKDVKGLKEYKSMNEILCCTVGRNGGVAYINAFGGVILGDWFVKMVKAKTLLVPDSRKGMGYAS
jgi:NADH dehydrogenase FAD-containing subunit